MKKIVHCTLQKSHLHVKMLKEKQKVDQRTKNLNVYVGLISKKNLLKDLQI